MWRANASDTIGRAADRARGEAEYLKQGFSKWSIDAAGAIQSKDFAFQGRARGLRTQTEFAARDLDDPKDRLENRK